MPRSIADPRKIIDIDEAVELLTATVPDLDAKALRAKLTQPERAFAWLKREVSPAERDAIYDLGIPGVGFVNETQRVYPMGRLAAHVLGYVDLDSQGHCRHREVSRRPGRALYRLARRSRDAIGMPAQISVDIRVQHALADELAKAIAKFKAMAGGGIVLDVDTGEVVGARLAARFQSERIGRRISQSSSTNQMTSGVFELGSVIKAVTFAMALRLWRDRLSTSRYDARVPAGDRARTRSTITTPTRRVLTVPEIFIHSSNIGTAKMALDVGPERHQEFLRRVGLFDRLLTEVPESAKPLLPPALGQARHRHGRLRPRFCRTAAARCRGGGRPSQWRQTDARRPSSSATAAEADGAGQAHRQAARPARRCAIFSGSMCEKGTASKADAIGYRVGGKTGTAEKVVNGRYAQDNRLTSFIGAFPMETPRYVLMVMLDEPQGDARDLWLRHRGLECGADGRQDHRAHRADARRRADAHATTIARSSQSRRSRRCQKKDD